MPFCHPRAANYPVTGKIAGKITGTSPDLQPHGNASCHDGSRHDEWHAYDNGSGPDLQPHGNASCHDGFFVHDFVHLITPDTALMAHEILPGTPTPVASFDACGNRLMLIWDFVEPDAGRYAHAVCVHGEWDERYGLRLVCHVYPLSALELSYDPASQFNGCGEDEPRTLQNSPHLVKGIGAPHAERIQTAISLGLTRESCADEFRKANAHG